MPDFAWVVAAIAALGGIITAVTALRKANEDSAKGASERWAKLVDSLQKSNEDMQGRVQELENLNDERAGLRQAMEYEMRKQADEIKALREHEAETALKLKSLMDAEIISKSMHAKLQIEHDELKAGFKRLSLRVEYYRKIVATLMSQLREAGLEPAVKPEEEDNAGSHSTDHKS